jgi:hypothetical protein
LCIHDLISFLFWPSLTFVVRSRFWPFTDVLRENWPGLTRKVGEIVEAGITQKKVMLNRLLSLPAVVGECFRS